MRQSQSPFGIERRLTPELFDHYVAKARAERAKAIADFFNLIARWLGALRRRKHPSPDAAGLTGSRG